MHRFSGEFRLCIARCEEPREVVAMFGSPAPAVHSRGREMAPQSVGCAVGMLARGEVSPMVVASPRTFGTYNSNDRVARLEGALDAGDIPFESRTQTGGHNWDFWRASFPEIVLFHSAAFGPGEAPGVCSKTSAHRPPGDDGDRP